MNRGITIIEVILVVAIMATLSLMSISFYSRFLTQNSVYVTRDQIVSSLRKAQIYSMTGKKNGIWGVRYVSTPSHKIVLYLTGNSGFDETFSINDNITVSGFDVSFARITGLPCAVATVTISGGNNNKTITINSQGVVSKN